MDYHVEEGGQHKVDRERKEGSVAGRGDTEHRTETLFTP